MNRKIKVFCFVALLSLATSQVSGVIFDLSGPYSPGTNGNIRTFTSGSLSVNVSAWNSDSAGNNWSTAALGQYQSGLGVENSTDASDRHTLDNIDSADYILFEFSSIVAPDSALLDWAWNSDSDMTLWIGNFTDPFTNHLDLTLVTTADFVYLEHNYGSGNRLADFNNGWVAGNALLIAGNINESDDSFKIRVLNVPDSGTSLSMLGLALIGIFSLCSRSRKR